MLKKLGFKKVYKDLLGKDISKQIRKGTMKFDARDAMRKKYEFGGRRPADAGERTSFAVENLLKDKKINHTQARELKKYIFGRKAAREKALGNKYWKETAAVGESLAYRGTTISPEHNSMYFLDGRSLKRAIKDRINIRAAKKREVFK